MTMRRLLQSAGIESCPLTVEVCSFSSGQTSIREADAFFFVGEDHTAYILLFAAKKLD